MRTTHSALMGAEQPSLQQGAPRRTNGPHMSHLATGISLADENLCRRPARFITEANMARLDKVRSAYDPDGRFHSWMGGV